MIQIQLRTKHAGRWAIGNLIVRIIWRKETLTLSSGFLATKKREDVKAFKAELEKGIQKEEKLF